MILHAPMNRRLTYAQAQAIRRRYAALRAQDGLQPGERVGEGDACPTVTALAAAVGMCPGTMSNLLAGITYRAPAYARTGGHPHLGSEARARILAAYQAGEAVAAIAAREQTTRQTVWQIARDAGVTRSRGGTL